MKSSSANSMTLTAGAEAPTLGNGFAPGAAVVRSVVVTVTVVLISLITILVSTG